MLVTTLKLRASGNSPGLSVTREIRHIVGLTMANRATLLVSRFSLVMVVAPPAKQLAGRLELGNLIGR